VHRRDQIRLKGLGQVYHRKRIAAGASKTEAYVASNATSPASSTTTTQTTET
jgi:hypothetical protein